MATSFQFSPGRLRAPLRTALPLCVGPTEVEARGFLDRSRWEQDHAKGTARANLRFAATWLFTRAYVTDGKHLTSDAALLAEQAVRITQAGQPNTSSPHATYLVATAAVRWAAGESLPQEPLAEAAAVLDRLDGSDSGVKLVTTHPRDAGWQRLLAAALSVEVSVRALQGDWAWIDRVWAAGLGYVDTFQKVSPHGLLLRFWKRLAEVASADGQERLGAIEGCRQALNDLTLSWASSFTVGEPWDGSPALLYLAGWAFERTVTGREPTAAEINEGLRGDV